MSSFVRTSRPRRRVSLIGWVAATALAHATACGSATQGSEGTEPIDEPSGGRPPRDGGTTIDLPSPEGGASGNECQRVVEFAAVKLAEPPPFDVVIVADHSDSLSWSRDDLAEGLATLLTNVRGREVRLFVLTPTQYGASSAAAEPWLLGNKFVSWRDPVTGEAYQNAMTEYRVECTDALGASMPCPEDPHAMPVTLTARGTWELRMPEPVATLLPDMTEAELAEQQEALSNAILSLAGSGAPVEQPLCTLNRYIVRDRALLPQNAVFLVISDEDDTTDPRHCLVGHTTTQTVGGETLTPCNADCDEYRYTMTRTAPTLSVKFDCVPVDDLGTPYPELAQPRGASLPSVDCEPDTTAPCAGRALEAAQNLCAPGTLPFDCVASCSAVKRGCALTQPDATTNLCTQPFTHRGTTYQDLADFCTVSTGLSDWGACERAGYKRTPGTGSRSATMSPEPIVSGQTTRHLIDNFHKHARAAFGEDGYKVQAIILDPAFSCPVRMGQSYGTNLRALASSPADVFPICEPYSAALDDIKGFAATLVQTEYPLRLESDEVVESITITDGDGGTRTLRAGFTHDPATNVLTIAPGVLTSNDRDLSVEVVANCRPIPR